MYCIGIKKLLKLACQTCAWNN